MRISEFCPQTCRTLVIPDIVPAAVVLAVHAAVAVVVAVVLESLLEHDPMSTIMLPIIAIQKNSFFIITSLG